MMQVQKGLQLSPLLPCHRAQPPQCSSALHFLTLPVLHLTAQHSLRLSGPQAGPRPEQSLSTRPPQRPAPLPQSLRSRPLVVLQKDTLLLLTTTYPHYSPSTFPQVNELSSG